MFKVLLQEDFEKLRQERDVLLLDIRKGEDFEKAHIEGAVSLPIHKFSLGPVSQWLQQTQNLQRAIVVYCYRGVSSQGVCVHLMELFPDVDIFNLAGGATAAGL